MDFVILFLHLPQIPIIYHSLELALFSMAEHWYGHYPVYISVKSKSLKQNYQVMKMARILQK